MKFSEAIQQALNEGAYIVCRERNQRMEHVGHFGFCAECPVVPEIMRDMGINVQEADCPLDIIQDIHDANHTDDDKDAIRHAAEELILCLEAQGD